tara:strand:+ start:376 stop:567 length:192 start_codon:yes stop_codon:yes gene_type:complete
MERVIKETEVSLTGYHYELIKDSDEYRVVTMLNGEFYDCTDMTRNKARALRQLKEESFPLKIK